MGYSGHRERSRKGKKREGKGKEEKRKKLSGSYFSVKMIPHHIHVGAPRKILERLWRFET